MKIFAHSYFPVLKAHQAGGAQYAMHEILVGLAREGFEITLICPETDNEKLISHDNIHVIPVLKEKAERSLSLYERTYNLQCLHEHISLSDADIVWTLDVHFPLNVKQPIVLSLGTIAYEDELNSLLGFNWDKIVVPSKYLESIVSSVANPSYWPPSQPFIEVIQHGVNINAFIPTASEYLYDKLRLSPGKYLLFPHRPEAAKGFDVALAVLHKLVSHDESYKLLIPTYPESVKYCLAKERTYYKRLAKKVSRMGLAEHVIFHSWVDIEDLPAYYSLGEWCLVLSELPEGFGFTPILAVSCGTPVISTRAGALRERFPVGYGVTYVNPGEVKQITESIIGGASKFELLKGRYYVEHNYSSERCIREYSECFDRVKKRGVSNDCQSLQMNLRVSPWCYLIDEYTVWHDLDMRRIKLSQKESVLLRAISEARLIEELWSDKNCIERLLGKGIVIRTWT